MSVFQSYTDILAAAPSGTTADDLAADFVQSQLGGAAANVSYTGSTDAIFDVDSFDIAGLVPDAASVSYSDGLMLSSGGFVDDLNNNAGFSVDLGQPGDPQLSAVAAAAFSGAGTTNDASVLNFDIMISEGSLIDTLRVEIVFGSDEYPEYSDSSFVDVGAIIVNGVNYALFNNDPTTPLSVISSNVNPLSDGSTNFINNTAGAYGVEWDGFSNKLIIRAPLIAGTNAVMIGVADTGDSILDSAMFIDGMSLVSGGSGGGVLTPVAPDSDGNLSPSLLPEELQLQPGQQNTASGTPEEFNGDVVVNMDEDDELVFEDTIFDQDDAELDNGVIEIDTDDDGVADTFVTVTGEVTGLAVQNQGSNTVVKVIPLDPTDPTDPTDPGVAIIGTSGVDKVKGSAGDDVMLGGGGKDLLEGLAGNDLIAGQAGDDRLRGGAGEDTLSGGAGEDVLDGGMNADLLLGGQGNDRMFGGGGDDVLKGGNGKDRLDAGAGDDDVSGGGGEDSFVFDLGDGMDVFTDFSLAQNDHLVLSGAVTGGLDAQGVLDTYGTMIDGNAVLDFGGGDVIVFANLTDLAGMAGQIEFI